MTKHSDSTAAAIGCWIKVKEEGADEEETYQLTHVTNALKDQLAPDNPMGKALIGARAGDEVTVHGPSGPIKFSVLDIGSEDPNGRTVRHDD